MELSDFISGMPLRTTVDGDTVYGIGGILEHNDSIGSLKVAFHPVPRNPALPSGSFLNLSDMFAHDTGKRCPRCRASFYPEHGALSRRDNKTKICPRCGESEAFEDAGMESAFEGRPYWDITKEVDHG